MRKCCLNCHFLAKTHGEFKFAWDRTERAAGKVDNPPFRSMCRMGVWNPFIDQPDRPLAEVLQKRRGNRCFFTPYQPGMSFDAAKKLLEQQAQQRRSKWAKIAVGISFLALVVLVANTFY